MLWSGELGKKGFQNYNEIKNDLALTYGVTRSFSIVEEKLRREK